jgi:Uma2 family endonuclease
LYAREGIAYYWIVNLVDHRVEVYTDPTGADANPAYRHREDYSSTDPLPLVIAGEPVAMVRGDRIFA